jgi:type IV pilus biogenesis protein CpaD/CtpE
VVARATRAAVAAAVLLAGCTSMHKVKDPTSYITTVRPKMVRVTQKDGSKLSVIGAQMQGDTLYGFVDRPNGVMHEYTEIPLQDVTAVEAQQWAHGKTLLAVGGGLAASAGIIYLYVKQAEGQGSGNYCNTGLYTGGAACPFPADSGHM